MNAKFRAAMFIYVFFSASKACHFHEYVKMEYVNKRLVTVWNLRQSAQEASYKDMHLYMYNNVNDYKLKFNNDKIKSGKLINKISIEKK